MNEKRKLKNMDLFNLHNRLNGIKNYTIEKIRENLQK